MAEAITGVEVFLLKWIVAPFIGALLIFTLYINSQSIDKCQTVCQEKGYADFKHYAKPKFGSARCYCLTTEEVPNKDKVMNLGNRVF